MTKTKSLYHGHRFPATIISHTMRWYFPFQLSLRDIEELLFERCVRVSCETIRRWCEKFGAGFAHRVKAARQGHRQTLLQTYAALKPGATQHRYRSIAQLSGSESRHYGALQARTTKFCTERTITPKFEAQSKNLMVTRDRGR